MDENSKKKGTASNEQSDTDDIVGQDESQIVDDSTKLAAELDKSKKDYLYLLAEFDNYKKHSIRERADLLKYGSERIIRELLDVVDNFERALQTEITESNLDTFKNGINLIHRELLTLMNRFGVTEINPEGEAFDPNMHEALTSEESDRLPPGHVSRVFKKAYKLHDKLVRPAQVVVSRAPDSKEGE